MRKIVLLISSISLVAASCADTPETTVEARSTVATVANVGEIANSENNESAPASTPAPSATNAPSVAQTAPPTVAPSAAQQTTNNSGEQVGDGTVLISTPQAAGGNDALVPVFFDFIATVTTGCANTDQGTVKLQWEVIGTESVSIAIGTDSQILRAGEPPAGSLDVPLDCAAGSTYFVIAANPSGRTVRSATVAP
jgi:predicted small secreted protein